MSRNPFGRWRANSAAPPRAPRRLIAARVALIAASLTTLPMILALPRPTTSRAELVALAALSAVAIAGIVAAALVTRRAPYGRMLAVALGMYGLGMALWRLPSMLSVLGAGAGPGPVLLLAIVGTVWAAHIFAAACVLSLREAWPASEAAADRR